MANVNKDHFLYKLNLEVILRYSYLQHVVFLGLVALSIFGDLISEFFPRQSRFYWFMMIPVFGLSTVMLEAARIKKLGSTGREIFNTHFIHWGAAALAVVTVLFLYSRNHLSDADTGLVIHIILAMATFLEGIHLGWKFYLLGFLLFLLAALAAYDLTILETLLVIILPTILLGLYLEEHSEASTFSKK